MDESVQSAVDAESRRSDSSSVNVPEQLVKLMENAGLAQRSPTIINGAQGQEIRFLPQATEYITRFFKSAN